MSKKGKKKEMANTTLPSEQNIEGLMPVLEALKLEYSHEDEKYKNLDFRASILLTVMAAFLTFFTASFDFGVIKDLTIMDDVKFWVLLIYFLSGATVVVLLLISFIYTIRIIKTVDYFRIPLNDWVDMRYFKEKYFTGAMTNYGIISQLIKNYANATIHNNDKNRTKIDSYRIVIKLLTISLFFIVFCFLLTSSNVYNML